MLKFRCAILDDYQNVALKMADWSLIENQVEITVFTSRFDTEEELISTLQDYSIIVIMRERTAFPASTLRCLPKLQLLVTSGMRNAAIDLVAAKEQGIVVCGTATLSEPPTELTWALLLNLARSVSTENAALRSNGPWQSTVGIDLYGKQLGIVGLGKIGCRISRIAKAFGMQVVAWSQNLTKEKAEQEGVILASSKDELIKESDFITIHIVLSNRTKNLIGESEFKLMKETALLINTSRADIINQLALINALENKKIAGAALDVFDCEPLPIDHPFRRLSNVLATPHLGYVSENNYRIYFSETVENIQSFLNQQSIRLIA
jgi:phosphoglycerate dehydrogenase-like enzyme